MKQVIFALLLSGTAVLCSGSPLSKDHRKMVYYCNSICESCQGVSKIQDSVCYCEIKDDEETQQCIESAQSKADFYGIDLVTLSPPGKQVRPVRGSILDPMMNNELNRIHPDYKDQINNNALQKYGRRLYKRSLGEEMALENGILGKMSGLDDFSTKYVTSEGYKGSHPDPNQRLRRGLTPYRNFQSYQPNGVNAYELILEYPHARGSEGDSVQFLFTDTPGLDVEQEYYYQENDEDEDDEDCYEIELPRLVDNSNQGYEQTFQPTFYPSPLSRDARSLWNYYSDPGFYYWRYY